MRRNRQFPVCRAAASAAVAAFACGFAPLAADAASGQWQKADFASARLISAAEGSGAAEHLKLGVEINLKDDWKTYWRSPGDAGLPPTLDWTGSANFKSAALAYPAPERFQLFGLQTFGYSRNFVFPIDVIVTEPGKPFAGRAKLDMLVCEKVCVPQTLNLAIDIPAGPATPGAEAQILNRFASAVPGNGGAAGLSLVSATTGAAEDGTGALNVVLSSQIDFAAPDLFAEIEPVTAFKAPIVVLSADRKTASMTLPLAKPMPPGVKLNERLATLTVVDGARSAQFDTRILGGAGADDGTTNKATSLGQMILIALFGGLILNLMPCVLPVVSIKLMSFIKSADEPLSRVRAASLANAAGIVVSMLAIAGLLIALKSAGVAIGWGVQFQQPVFIAAMALIVTLFACNLWGLFEIIAPGSVSNFADQTSGEGKSLWSNFLTGVFATVLATPCSAPFVGISVGFALAQGPVQILAIFAALGVGLAIPYLAASAAPQFVRLMPRPGKWMVTLQRVMALALVATSIWLLSVLAAQSGKDVALLTAALLVTLTVALFVRRALPKHRAVLAAGAALAGAIAVLAPAVGFGVKPSAIASLSTTRLDWSRLDIQRIKSLVAQGKTVFVDVTADWCITCQANKRIVLDQSPIVDRLANETITMRGDWTSPDPEITAFLAQFGRYGVPLNVVFGPGDPSGIALPELLTARAVDAAIEKAAAL